MLCCPQCTNITVVGMETEPFERVLGPKIGAFMRAMHEAQGVKFRMGAVVSQFKCVGVQRRAGEKCWTGCGAHR